MPEYIERDFILPNGVFYSNADNPEKSLDKLLERIASAPAADVAEVRHGEWVYDEENECVCSCCGVEAQYISRFNETFDYDWEENLVSTGYEETKEYILTPYCPNCGAKMDGKGESDG